MSIPKLISPMLDNFNMGDAMGEHNGVRCCPAIEKHSEDKYIVKIISVPSAPSQLDALLLSGAYPNAEAAMAYFKSVTDGIVAENRLLEKLSQLDGFIPFENCQIEPMEDEAGYDVYLLRPYGTTLEKLLQSGTMTQLGAMNLGLDLCSALGVCRQSGYLYADLKPGNIYVTSEGGYRIGDLGFLKLSSLKYSSLPERYRSAYTAPEISDAYSELNTTIDVYALGLILYQVFNNGMLPNSADNASNDTFQAPAYADYELTEIILKACAPNPEDRWQDPETLGQALVAYMQRNGVHDIPIVPTAQDEIAIDDETEIVGSFEAQAEEAAPEEAQTEEAASAEPEPEITVTESDIYTEDEDGNLVLLTDDESDETLPNEQTGDIPDAVVTEEVSDMLQQADELIAHPAPDPVVQPEPIDVPIPEPITDWEPQAEKEEAAEEIPKNAEEGHESADDSATEEASETPAEESENESCAVTAETEMDETAENDPPDDSEEITDDEDNEEEDEEDIPRRRRRWIWPLILSLLTVALIICGTYFYQNYYLQHIESMKLEETGDGIVTVTLDTKADAHLLSVVCSDTYGSIVCTSPVEDGKAILTDLVPDTKYTIKVVIEGFHKLTGDFTENYTTANRITVSDFTAETGSTDGEVILYFTADASETTPWFVTYIDDNGKAVEVSITNNTVTITGLTVGNTYTFTLTSPEADNLVGMTQIRYTAKAYIGAENLTVTGCIDHKLQLVWNAPEGVSVDSWTVRCTGGNGFNETKTVSETSAEFTVPDDSVSYLLEVIAKDMTFGETTRSPANALTIADIQIDETDPTALKLSWSAYGNIPADGWLLSYTIDGIPQPDISVSETFADIIPVVPNSVYSFTIQPVGDMVTMGGSVEYTSPAVTAFEGYGIIASDMEFTLCSRPAEGYWDRYTVKKSDKRSQFSAEESIGFLVRMNNTYNTSSDEIVILYVIRDSEGNSLDVSTMTQTWDDMWTRGHCKLNVPNTPQVPGEYTLHVYFNGALATQTAFTISN